MDMAVNVCMLPTSQDRRNMQWRKADVWESWLNCGWNVYERDYHGHHLRIEHLPEACLMFLTVDGVLQNVNYIHDIERVEALLIRHVDNGVIYKGRV